MKSTFPEAQSHVDKRMKLLEKIEDAELQTSQAPVIEEQKQPLNSTAFSEGPSHINKSSGEQSSYSLEENTTPLSADDSELPSRSAPLLAQNAQVGRRHASMRMDRPDAFTEEIQIHVRQQKTKITTSLINRHSRQDIEEALPEVERQYVDGVPLLMSLNEIMNLDVISIAMDEQYEEKVRKQRQRVLPGDDDSDPNIYVEETITFQLPTSAQQTSQQEEETDSEANYEAWKTEGGHQLDVLYVKSMQDGIVEDLSLFKDAVHPETSDDDELTYVTEEQANRMAMTMMLQGEHPDAEIDKLLETFGVQVSQIGLIPLQNFFKGELIENDMRVREELREQIEEIRAIFKNWNSDKTSETTRKLFLMQLADTADSLGVSLAVEHLLPGLLDIIQDSSIEPEKFQNYISLLFNELGKLISFLSQSAITVGYTGIRDNLTPLYNDFFLSDLIDDNTRGELQSLAIEQLAMVTKVLINEDRIEKVLPIVLELLKDDTDEEKRIVGLELLDVLAADFGSEICQNYLIYEIVSLQDDPVYKVRKETVRRITNISKVVSAEVFIGVLLPVFKKLCTDQIWGVRRQAVEVLPEMCKLAPDEIKNGSLVDIFKKFTKDQSKWVKQAATQFLGPFIVCYEGLEPSPVLLDFYSEMVEENIKPSGGVSTAQNSEDVLYHCAFNFPAVLLTLGPKAWPQLKHIHTKLVRDSRVKVRKTLSYSLFELAKILGEELTETELISVLLHFLKDVAEVKEGVLVTLPDFMACLNATSRESYFDKLAQGWAQSEENWRKREQKASQIGRIAKLMTAQGFQAHYMTHYFDFCEDQVAYVRETATKSCYQIVNLLEPHPEFLDGFMEKVLAFKHAKRFSMRQTFIMMCESMVRGDPDDQSAATNKNAERMFKQYFLKSFVELQSDRIVNVRLQLSNTLALLYEKNERLERMPEEEKDASKQSSLQGPVQKVYSQSELCMDPKVIKMVRRLRVDSNKDISHVLRHINLPKILNDSDDEASSPLAAEKIEDMLLKSNITKHEAEQIQETNTAEQQVEQLLALVYESAIGQLGHMEEIQRTPEQSDIKSRVAEAEKAAESMLQQISEDVLQTLQVKN